MRGTSFGRISWWGQGDGSSSSNSDSSKGEEKKKRKKAEEKECRMIWFYPGGSLGYAMSVF